MRRPAADVVKRLGDALAKGWEPGLTVLTGEDRFHLDAAQAALLEHLAPRERTDLALTLFAGSPTDVAEVVAAARSKAMFAERRVVLVRDVEVLVGDPPALVAYAADPPPDSFLIVRAPKLDLRRPLHKALITAGRVLEFDPGETTPETIARLGADRGLDLDPDLAALVAEVCGGDLYRATAELDKLDALLGGTGKRRVRFEDARAIVFGGGTLSGWEIADALLRRDLRAGLTAVRRLVAAGEEPLRLVGGLAWRTRTLIQAKAMLAAGHPERRALAAARGDPRALAAALSRYELSELMAFPSRLLHADRCLKSRTLDPGAVLESLVRDLIAPRGSWGGA
jgi:DNA polymerase-3 subunit delta